ncbi:MAG: hypothetical protein ACPKQO_01565 [Nitrososphaeraceae archaeon]
MEKKDNKIPPAITINSNYGKYLLNELSASLQFFWQSNFGKIVGGNFGNSII